MVSSFWCWSLLQHHSSKAINSLALSLLYGPTFTSIHDYWKNIALTRQTFVSKVMSLKKREREMGPGVLIGAALSTVIKEGLFKKVTFEVTAE